MQINPYYLSLFLNFALALKLLNSEQRFGCSIVFLYLVLLSVADQNAISVQARALFVFLYHELV